MPDLICGFYEYDATGRSLTQPLTRQSIRLTHQEDGGFWFDYLDDEVTVSFVVERAEPRHTFMMNLDRSASRAIAECYGLWRRVAFFLLDALPVWFSVAKRPDERFLASGYLRLLGERRLGSVIRRRMRRECKPGRVGRSAAARCPSVRLP